jgi:teichuronic acid biosynthesis glycosyltransferase TuaG
MSVPVVSIIMPAYNAEKFIEESIESVINQTYANWELLIVDDGSTDATKNRIESFCKQDGRIKCFRQPNGKQGKARNLALSQARGEYIAFLDADDLWLPEKLELQLVEIKEKNVALVFSDTNMFTEKGSIKLMNSGKGFFSGEKGMVAFLEMNKIPILTVLVKREVLREVGGFSENKPIQNAEDYHLWLRLLIRGYIFYGSERILAKYRVHSTSSSSDDKLAAACVVEAFEELKKENKQYSNLINCYQKKWFVRYHYSTNRWRKKDYKTLIKKNCAYADKRGYELVFRVLYLLLGFNITRRFINRIINNQLVF